MPIPRIVALPDPLRSQSRESLRTINKPAAEVLGESFRLQEVVRRRGLAQQHFPEGNVNHKNRQISKSKKIADFSD